MGHFLIDKGNPLIAVGDLFETICFSHLKSKPVTNNHTMWSIGE